MAQFWINLNFALYLVIFAVAMVRNANFNTVMVGLTYMAPMVPMGLTPANADRFLVVSFTNLIFGAIELAIFVITVRKQDLTFDKDHIRQLFGHVLPITLALIGLSYLARMTHVPLGALELSLILFFFITGSILRVLAVYQIGARAFKFDIVFREKQQLKSDQLYRWVRHPSYTSMMLVVLAYAINTHSWLAGTLGMLSAWFGFQYRIHFEENALQKQFGKAYDSYRERTGMWLPRWKA